MKAIDILQEDGAGKMLVSINAVQKLIKTIGKLQADSIGKEAEIESFLQQSARLKSIIRELESKIVKLESVRVKCVLDIEDIEL